VNHTRSLQLDAKTQAIMRCVDALEQSEHSESVDLRRFLGEVAPEDHADALAELAIVDLERRWRHGGRPEVVKYLDEYPELRERDESVLDLLQTDFELRSKHGHPLDPSDYQRLHPGFKPRTTAPTDHSALPTELFPGESRVAPPELTNVAKYRIEQKLGSGGFGVVYRAFDEKIERTVALKIQSRRSNKPSPLDDDLLHEARSVARLDHPNIVRLLDAGETADGVGYVAYQYIEGETLLQAIRRRDYDHVQAAEWVAQIADALHYAHQRGIVHRDIKPANIMLDAARRPKLLDFGLARRDDAYYRDDSRQILGTLSYMSPEQARGDSDWASSQTDVYSLGIVLYELLCNRVPFRATDKTGMLNEVLERIPPPPRSLDDSIPIELEQVCLKAIAKSPADRFTTCADMAAAVRCAVRPRQPWVPILIRSAAGLVAVAALCVALLAIFQPRVAAPAAPPEISSYNLLFADSETPVNGRLPLTPRDRLKVEATFTTPAYAYLIVYDDRSPGRLLWPPPDDLDRQQPVSRLIYPSLAGDGAPVQVPDSDGAMFVVAIASREPLSPHAISELVETRLELNLPSELAAQLQTSFQIADPVPRFHQGIPTRAGGAAELRVAEAFKQSLHRFGSAYLGNLVPHAKAPPRSGE